MILEIVSISVLVAFWLSGFLQLFGLGRNNFDMVKWGVICLAIGWVIYACSWPLGGWGGEIPDWQGCLYISLFFASSLGSGYLCGWNEKRRNN